MSLLEANFTYDAELELYDRLRMDLEGTVLELQTSLHPGNPVGAVIFGAVDLASSANAIIEGPVSSQAFCIGATAAVRAFLLSDLPACDKGDALQSFRTTRTRDMLKPFRLERGMLAMDEIQQASHSELSPHAGLIGQFFRRKTESCMEASVNMGLGFAVLVLGLCYEDIQLNKKLEKTFGYNRATFDWDDFPR